MNESNAGNGTNGRQPLPPVASGIEDEELRLEEYIRVLRRHWRLIGFVTGVCVLLGLIVTLAQTKIYEASTTIALEQQQEALQLTEDLSPLSRNVPCAGSTTPRRISSPSVTGSCLA